MCIYSGVELSGHMVILCLAFKEQPNWLPHWLYRFIIPLAIPKASNFSWNAIFKRIVKVNLNCLPFLLNVIKAAIVDF